MKSFVRQHYPNHPLHVADQLLAEDLGCHLHSTIASQTLARHKISPMWRVLHAAIASGVLLMCSSGIF